MPTETLSRPSYLPLESEKGERPRAKVIRHLKTRIENGELPPGQVLPSALELSQSLGVNWKTVTSALQMLDDEGVIRSNGGRLRIVNDLSAKNGGGREPGLMEHAVLVLAPDAGQLWEHRRGGGWAEYVTQGVLSELNSTGLHAVVLHPDRLQGAQMARLVAEHPRGAVLTELFTDHAHLHEIVSTLHGAGVPVAIYGDGEPFSSLDRVVSDHEAGAYAVTKALLGRGCTRPLPVWPDLKPAYWKTQRQNGYRRAMREAGLEPLPDTPLPYPEGHLNADEFERGARLICGYLAPHLVGKNAADALVLATDGNTPLSAAAARFCGRVPGEDLLLAGYDNYWDEVPHREWEAARPLFTVDKNNRAIGQELVRLLERRIAGELPATPQFVRVAPLLLEVAPAS